MSFNLYLDTREAQALVNGTPSDAVYNLQWGQLHLADRGYSVSLEQASIPNLVYGVNGNNAVISFSENGSPTILTATLTHGNYTPALLATELKTRLDAAGSNTYTVVYTPTTGKLTITANATNTFAIRSPSELLGFTTINTFSISKEGNHVIRLDGTLYVDVVAMNLRLPSRTTSGRTNVLARIYLDVGFGFIQRYDNSNNADAVPLLDGSINQLEVQLRDDQNRLWVLPETAHVGLTLRFEKL
jgi:hypothetical protein